MSLIVTNPRDLRPVQNQLAWAGVGIVDKLQQWSVRSDKVAIAQRFRRSRTVVLPPRFVSFVMNKPMIVLELISHTGK